MNGGIEARQVAAVEWPAPSQRQVGSQETDCLIAVGLALLADSDEVDRLAAADTERFEVFLLPSTQPAPNALDLIPMPVLTRGPPCVCKTP